VTFSDLAKYSSTRSVSATVEFLVENMLMLVTQNYQNHSVLDEPVGLKTNCSVKLSPVYVHWIAG